MLDEFFEELLEEFEEEFELLLELLLFDEFDDELDDEFELPLELLLLDELELLLPALIFRGFTLASTPCAACVSSFTSGRVWAWALWLPTTLATAVTMAPMLFFHLVTPIVKATRCRSSCKRVKADSTTQPATWRV